MQQKLLQDIEGLPWQQILKVGVEMYLEQNVKGKLDITHIEDTPKRVVASYADYVSGYMEDPKVPLKLTFAKGNYDEMVHCERIRIASRCAHHFEPIIGIAHFAYVPDGAIVGLSKIPRFIRILSRRLQVQENLTEEIADTFQSVVKPKGCAVAVKCYHFCMLMRGVQEHEEITKTVALRGCFKSDAVCRQEFLSSINPNETVFP